MKSVLIRLVTILAMISATAGLAFAGNVRVKLPKDGGSLVLEVPQPRKETVRIPRPDQPPTITLTPRTGQGFEVLITPIWQAGRVMPMASAQEIHAVVQRGADKRSAIHATAPFTVHDFVGPKIVGSYFSHPGEAPPRDGTYKNLTQGLLAVNELRIAFTILSNDDTPTLEQIALKLLKSLRHE